MSMYDGRKFRNVMRLGSNPADIAAAVQSELDRNPNQSIRIAPNGDLSHAASRKEKI